MLLSDADGSRLKGENLPLRNNLYFLKNSSAMLISLSPLWKCLISTSALVKPCLFFSRLKSEQKNSKSLNNSPSDEALYWNIL